jgi:rubrerythrin
VAKPPIIFSRRWWRITWYLWKQRTQLRRREGGKWVCPDCGTDWTFFSTYQFCPTCGAEIDQAEVRRG